MEEVEDKAMNPKFERLGYKDQVLDIINSLELSSETDKSILKSRFLYEVLNYDARKLHTKKYYNGFRFVVTVGSILLPAILSIGQMDPAKLPKNFDSVTYWGAWSISLMVTVSNGFLQLFSFNILDRFTEGSVSSFVIRKIIIFTRELKILPSFCL